MVQKPESDSEPKERRIDLSLPQVAGSAVAAVAAAVAASQLGVYGTILGAGVMSVVATTGGSVFQHLFRRTGEQIREVTVQAKQNGREPGGTAVPSGQPQSSGPDRAPEGAADATTVLPAVDPLAMPSGQDATTVLRAVGGGQDLTRPMRSVDATRPLTAARPGTDEEFSEATTHGTRFRGWKRSAAGAAAVFALAMGGITTYELVSGNGLSGGHGTTVGSVVRGGERDSGTTDPAPSTSTGPGSDRSTEQENGTTPGTNTGEQEGTGQTRDPGTDQGGRTSDGPAPNPSQPAGNGDQSGPSPAATPAPSVPGDGGDAPQAPGTGDAPVQGGAAQGGAVADPGTGSAR